MTTPIQLIRTYNTSDSQMLEFARVVHANYVADLADFTAFDADFDAPVGATLLTAIDAAEDFSSDGQLIDIVAQATLDVEAKMKECRDFFQGMKYFIEKAFPNKPGTWNEFGYNDYQSSRQVQARMIQFMIDLHETATKYATPLQNANMAGAQIAMISTLATQLQTLNTAQEKAKGERSTGTNDRVLLLNDCWAKVQSIRNVAKACYVNNWGKWQLYLLPWGGEGETPAPPEEITGTVPYDTTVNIPVPSLLPTSVLTITNTGAVDLRFCAGEVSGVDCGITGIVMIPGDSQAVTLQDLAPVGTTPAFLNVSNTVGPPGSPTGEFSVIKVS
jgi:hypothetical protein